MMGFQKSGGVSEKWWCSRKVMGYQKSDGVPDACGDNGMGCWGSRHVMMGCQIDRG